MPSPFLSSLLSVVQVSHATANYIVEFIRTSATNYTAGRGGRAIDGMAARYTATSAGAHNNLMYFSRPGAQASAHLFVDKDGAIRQSVCFENAAWAVGDFAENQRTVSEEVVSVGEDFTEAQIAALAEIYAYLRATTASRASSATTT